jgi:hypothetical protein
MGADPESNAFKFGKFTAEAAGVAGVPFARFARGTGFGGYAATVGKNALSGAAASGAIDPEYALTGAAVGGGLSGVGIPLGIGLWKGATYLKNAAEPYLPGGLEQIKGRALNMLAGNRRQQVIDALDKNRSYVPGSYPVAGEAATDAGAAPFVAAQEIVKRKGQSSAYAARELEQEQARKTALKMIGPGDNAVDLGAAEAIRKAAAEKNYGKAFAQGVR